MKAIHRCHDPLQEEILCDVMDVYTDPQCEKEEDDGGVEAKGAPHVVGEVPETFHRNVSHFGFENGSWDEMTSLADEERRKRGVEKVCKRQSSFR